jgi:hypothetical protein
VDATTFHYETVALEQRYKSGARWFFWIAGLSVITSLISLWGGGYAFFLSLGTTQLIDGFAKGLATELGDSVRIVALVLDIFVAGICALIGWLALKRQLWAFVVGMALFAVDALILLAFQVWLSFIFHALVIFWIFRGYQAARSLVALEGEIQAQTPPAPPTFDQTNEGSEVASAT